MSYRHIDNLYRDQRILMFKEAYALEKIHGTSAHVGWHDHQLTFFSGGEKNDRFVALFDQEALRARFEEHFGDTPVTVFGEAYGGSQQGQSWRYGPTLRFVAFEVCVGEHGWLNVPSAEDVALKLGIEFVYYRRITTDLASIDAERDAISQQAYRNGVTRNDLHVSDDRFVPREGVVLRPLYEFRDQRGERVMAKHKRDEERETKSPRKVVDPSQQQVIADAQAVADEWVTETRLDHVIDQLKVKLADSLQPTEKFLTRIPTFGIEHTGEVVRLMVADVLREGAGEIVESKAVNAAIGRAAAKLYKGRITRVQVS